jgi:hypothetical protein
MLLSKPYKNGDVVAFKLVNGDEIVAKLIDQTNDGWTIHKPCTVVPSERGLGLMQSLFSADINKDVELKSEHVMMHAPTTKALEDHYITTTTGIQTTSKGSILV